MRSLRICFAVALWVAPILAVGQDAPASAGPLITRADLATSYLRIEHALHGQKLTPERTAELNKAFDQATLAFFQKKFTDALRQIDAATASLSPASSAGFVKKAAALRVRMEPPVILAGADTPVALHLEQLYLPGAPGESIEGQVQVKDEQGRVRTAQDFRLRFEKDRPVDFVMAIRGDKASAAMTKAWIPEPGRYSIWIAGESFNASKTGAASLPGPSGRYTVAAESLQAISNRNAPRLDAIQPGTPALEQALASLKARNKLLTDAPDPENTAQYVLDPLVIAKQLHEEIPALEKGTDPFKNRKGDYWRVLKIGDKEIPLRVYLPEKLDPAKPLPLVIAFHGAGVDENAFMDAYGAGRLKQLADEHQFLLVTPLTYAFSGATLGDSFDALLQALGYDYSIDPQRIYVMGHSMGGGVTTAVVAARGAKIAAAAALCGFRGLPADAKDIPPIFVVAAELDPLASPKAVGPAAEAAKAAGLPVEYKLITNYGHTLVVGEILPEAVSWMLAKTR
jgi:polyhydroxybutyrate depolymerase